MILYRPWSLYGSTRLTMLTYLSSFWDIKPEWFFCLLEIFFQLVLMLLYFHWSFLTTIFEIKIFKQFLFINVWRFFYSKFFLCYFYIKNLKDWSKHLPRLVFSHFLNMSRNLGNVKQKRTRKTCFAMKRSTWLHASARQDLVWRRFFEVNRTSIVFS